METNNIHLDRIEQEIREHRAWWDPWHQTLGQDQTRKYEFDGDWGSSTQTTNQKSSPQVIAKTSGRYTVPVIWCSCTVSQVLPSEGARLCPRCKLWHKECSQDEYDRVCSQCVYEREQEDKQLFNIHPTRKTKKKNKNRDKNNTSLYQATIKPDNKVLIRKLDNLTSNIQELSPKVANLTDQIIKLKPKLSEVIAKSL